jgi:uncharacterized membrane protein
VNWFLALKYVHVLLAITAVGTNITYGAWAARSAREPEHLGFALRGIKFLDDRVANPCYAGLLLTGLILAAVGHIPYTTSWIVIGIALWVLLVIVAAALYTPTLSKQIKTLDAEGGESPTFQALSRRGTMVGIPLGVLAALIVLDMVVKPHF